MRRRTFLIAIALVPSGASATSADEASPKSGEAIREVLARQQAAWNAGDLERFLEGYWKSPGLTFSSGGATRRGYRATRERYLSAYPTRERMGKLAFRDLEVTPLGDSAAMVLGRWGLERASGEKLGGNFTLVMRRIDGRWVIVHDHTSSDPKASAPAAS